MHSLLESFINCITERHLLHYKLLTVTLIDALQNVNRRRVVIYSHDHLHDELLNDGEDVRGEVDLRLTTIGRYFILPFALGLQDYLFESLDHEAKPVLVEGVGNRLALFLPHVIRYRKKERVTEIVLEDACKQACLVD